MSRPAANKYVPLGRWGTKTSLSERMPIPAVVYHGAQMFPWAWRHRRGLGWFAVFVVWWNFLGFALGLVGLVLTWGCLTWWLVWRKDRDGVSVHSVRDYRDERVNRATLDRKWTAACQRFGLTDPNTKKPPRLRDVTGKPGGSIEARVVTADALVPETEFVRHASDFASVLRCQDVVVSKVGPGEVRIVFHWKDAMARTLPLADLPLAPRGRIAYGVQANGKTASVKMNLSVMIGGITESGKSSVVQAMIADLLRQQVPTWLYISDTKEKEFREYAKRVGQTNGNLTVKAYETEPVESEKMIALVVKNMATRARMSEGRDWSPSAENPLVVLIVDEFMDLHDTIKKGAASNLATLTRKGRSDGYVAWLGTQMAQKSAVGDVRDLTPQRIAMATRNRESTEMILGSGAVAAGAMSHEIRDDQPGTGYTLSESDRIAQRVRAAYVRDADLELIAAGVLPPALLSRTREAIGEVVGDHALYRWFNDRGELLYVGITNSVGRRTDEHSGKAWWPEVSSSRVEWFPSRKAALEAEKKAIVAEMPLFNTAHNTGNPVRVRLRRVDLRVDRRLSRKGAA